MATDTQTHVLAGAPLGAVASLRVSQEKIANVVACLKAEPRPRMPRVEYGDFQLYPKIPKICGA